MSLSCLLGGHGVRQNRLQRLVKIRPVLDHSRKHRENKRSTGFGRAMYQPMKADRQQPRLIQGIERVNVSSGSMRENLPCRIELVGHPRIALMNCPVLEDDSARRGVDEVT